MLIHRLEEHHQDSTSPKYRGRNPVLCTVVTVCQVFIEIGPSWVRGACKSERKILAHDYP